LDLPLEPPAYPGGRRGAVVLTHDIDSRADIGGIAGLRVLERHFGLKSSVGFIPQVSWPERDVIENLVAEGCEVYCHDLGHDGKLPYKSLPQIRAGFERFLDAHAYARPLLRGFRSGQLLMSAELLGALGEWFAYDLSLPDTERGGPYGASAGCASVYPFMIDGLLEIPLTMPQDFYLTNVEHYDSPRMLAVWRDKLEAVLACGGVAVVNTHPVWTTPRRPGVWAAYEGLLEAIGAADAWVTTPSSLSDWLGDRRDGRVRHEPTPEIDA
jgi:peptidoglycan/xylan/chitin deacetylase (PgdA/CDA1 family)